MYTTFCLSIHFVSGHLGCFHLLPIVNDTAMNISVQIFAQVPAFSSFGYISRSGIARSSGKFYGFF